MIPKINNLLYTTDLSKNSAYALRYAVNSAQHHKAKIHILHVLENGQAQGFRSWGDLPQVPQAELDEAYAKRKGMVKAEIEKRIGDFCKKELKSRPSSLKRIASIQVIEGDPADEILQKADELKADMVIMGTHGKGLLVHPFLGKVAEKVLNRINVPVIIVPLPQEKDVCLSDMYVG